MAVIIYRVEHKDKGIGPFNGWSRKSYNTGWLEWRNEYIGDRHPGPFCDMADDGSFLSHHLFKLQAINRKAYFGCSSLKQVRHWIGDYGPMFHNLGFVLRQYECKEKWCRVGKTQAIFTKRFAKLINTLSLEDL